MIRHIAQDTGAVGVSQCICDVSHLKTCLVEEWQKSDQRRSLTGRSSAAYTRPLHGPNIQGRPGPRDAKIYQAQPV